MCESMESENTSGDSWPVLGGLGESSLRADSGQK